MIKCSVAIIGQKAVLLDCRSLVLGTYYPAMGQAGAHAVALSYEQAADYTKVWQAPGTNK